MCNSVTEVNGVASCSCLCERRLFCVCRVVWQPFREVDTCFPYLEPGKSVMLMGWPYNR